MRRRLVAIAVFLCMATAAPAKADPTLQVTASHLGGGFVQYTLTAVNDLGGAVATQITVIGNIHQIPTIFFPDAPPDGGADLLVGQVDLAQAFDAGYVASGGLAADSWWDNTDFSTSNPPFNTILADSAVGGFVGSTEFSYSAASGAGSNITTSRLGQIVIFDPSAVGLDVGPVTVSSSGLAPFEIVDRDSVGPSHLPALSLLAAAGLTFPITGSFAVADAGVCPYVIEVNAVRGGSPSIKQGSKRITAKARIAKDTAVGDTTQPGTSLVIDAIRTSDGANLGSATAGGITLVVGRGGQGARVTVPVACNPGDQVEFVATFTGTPASGGGTCVGVGVSKIKNCQ